MVNDSLLSPREDHPMFGKSFEFKRKKPKSSTSSRFLTSLTETSEELNKELE